jgi:hypothetical protein
METTMARTDIASARRGFALPMALFVIGFLAVSITAAFAMMSGERRTNSNTGAQVNAFAIAQAGLEEYLGNRAALGFTTNPPGALEEIRVTLPGGYADVRSERVKTLDVTPAGIPSAAVYSIRSIGVDTSPRLVGTPIARRTVAQYAYWQKFSMQVRAGWTSIGGILKNGGSGVLSGTDGCGQQGAVAGVAVPVLPGYTQNGGTSVPSGSPAILPLGANSAGSADSVNIDWNAILNGGAVTPDVTLPGGTWPSFADPNYWPIIRVNGDLTWDDSNALMSPAGRGILIVTNNLTLSGAVNWRGVVFVGNKITSNGNNTIQGAVVTGLNAKLGQAVQQSDIGNGNKTFQYNSCNVESALGSFAALFPMPNAWMDNWASY